MLDADKPIGALLGTGSLDKEVVDIPLAIGDVGQAGVAELLGERVDAALPLDPAHALLLLERAVGVALLPETAGLTRTQVWTSSSPKGTRSGVSTNVGYRYSPQRLS